MKRLLLLAFLAAGIAGEAGAHGLYFGAGLGNTAPKLESSKGTCYSGYQYCYPGFEYTLGETAGWPSVGWNGPGDWFDYGGTETWKFNGSGSMTMILSAGWDFPQSPFRVELEYARTKYKAKSFDISVRSEGGVTVDDDGYPQQAFDPDDFYGAPFAGSWSGIQFDGNEVLDIAYKTMMLNVYFDLPFFDQFDTYVGLGVGTFQMDVSQGSWKQPESEDYFVPGYSGACGEADWTAGMCDGAVGITGKDANMIKGISKRHALQMMLGAEYRFPETPYIVGLEYRMLKVEDAADKANNSGNRMYVWDNWYSTLTHNQILIKGRYDFISDEY